MNAILGKVINIKQLLCS